MTDFSSTYKTQLLSALDTLPLDKVEAAISILKTARDEDRQVFVCGNGGSAATASHFVCDMVKGGSYGRPKRFRILSLNDNLHTITAYSNDVSYECVFVEQLTNFARPGDVLICISGSGNSPNVLRAAEYANQAGLTTIGLTGRDGGRLGPLSKLEINVAEQHMGRIEDGHMVACHMIAYYFMEREAPTGA
ncbi:SIS domain-containing protein [Paludibaculum fermentans]|uniref:SIS domain-containing protein n=1 Tax=Paludibaculum fermentans TaxID=1473598 RepID=A0A7S7SLJ0_PALFE|nr:SIS domain-containing protein [Paludibaculum fermentans]QOY90292.1 SIS domain-containing protein [Paludibaculum fermentans]